MSVVLQASFLFVIPSEARNPSFCFESPGHGGIPRFARNDGCFGFAKSNDTNTTRFLPLLIDRNWEYFIAKAGDQQNKIRSPDVIAAA
jgi:hypothetical protein